jgi:hypothetical protein
MLADAGWSDRASASEVNVYSVLVYNSEWDPPGPQKWPTQAIMDDLFQETVCLANNFSCDGPSTIFHRVTGVIKVIYVIGWVKPLTIASIIKWVWRSRVERFIDD